MPARRGHAKDGHGEGQSPSPWAIGVAVVIFALLTAAVLLSPLP